MNDRQLRSFVNAAEKKSFSKAAGDSFITIPALINQINTLEENTGINLFHRNTHGIELTREGKLFYEAAKQILLIYDDTITRCQYLRDEDVLRIGVCFGGESIMADFSLWHRWWKQSRVHIELEEMDERSALTALEDGLIPLCYGSRPNLEGHPELMFHPQREVYYDAIVSTAHPLSLRDHLSDSEMSNYETLKTTEDMTYLEKINHLDHRRILLAVGESGWYNSKNLSVIPTDVIAATYGFITRKKIPPTASGLMEDFLKFTDYQKCQ